MHSNSPRTISKNIKEPTKNSVISTAQSTLSRKCNSYDDKIHRFTYLDSYHAAPTLNNCPHCTLIKRHYQFPLPLHWILSIQTKDSLISFGLSVEHIVAHHPDAFEPTATRLCHYQHKKCLSRYEQSTYIDSERGTGRRYSRLSLLE